MIYIASAVLSHGYPVHLPGCMIEERGEQMKHFVEFPLIEGGSVVIEIDEPEGGGTVRAGRGDTLAKAKETLEDALDKVLPVTRSVVGKLRTLGDKPDEMEITFGVKLTTVAGAVIASAGAEANFEVTLRWTESAQEKAH